MVRQLVDIFRKFLGAVSERSEYVRDSKHAAYVFDTKGDGLIKTGYPRLRFQYFVNFVFNKQAIGQIFEDPNFTALVKRVDAPSISIDTQTLNQYNKKRIVQNRVNFNPIDLVFHDTVDSLTLKFWEAYYTHHFKDGDRKVEGGEVNKRFFANDIIAPEFDGNNFGVNLDRIQDQQYLLDRIEFFQVFGGRFKRIDLINPRIQSFTPDTFDYSDTTGLSEIRMSLAYEDVIYHDEIEELSQEDARRYENGDFREMSIFRRFSSLSPGKVIADIIRGDTSRVRRSAQQALRTVVGDVADTVVSGASSSVLGAFGDALPGPAKTVFDETVRELGVRRSIRQTGRDFAARLFD